MWRIALGHFFKLLIAITPFTLVPLWIKHPDWFPGGGLGTQPDKVEKALIAILTVADLMCLSVYEYYTHVVPRMDGRKFAESYVARVFDDFKNKCDEAKLALGQDVRINVMIVRTAILGPSCAKFEWFANRGFEAGQKDDSLILFTWQGLCGLAFRRCKTLGVDLRTDTPPSRWKPHHNFWLFPGQCSKTKHLKAIVSIPIYRQSKKGAMTTHKAVGVINLDAVSDDGADWILKERDAMSKFFSDSGTVLAHLATG